MFTDKVQGFYVEDEYSQPMLFLYNSIKDYHFGRKVFGYISDGSLCEIDNIENSFYPLTESNILLYRKIWSIQKKIDSLYESIPNTLESPDYEYYSPSTKNEFIYKIENFGCIIEIEDILYNVVENDSSNNKRKNDFIVEDDNGNRTTISMIEKRYFYGISINELISYKTNFDLNIEEEFNIYSEINNLQAEIVVLGSNFVSVEAFSIDIAKTFEPMLINDFFGEELISEELADLEIFKIELMNILPHSGYTDCERISVNSFFQILKGFEKNYFEVFVKDYYNSIRYILNTESQRLTIGLTKDATTFCSFDALCKCIIHNKALFEMVSDFIKKYYEKRS